MSRHSDIAHLPSYLSGAFGIARSEARRLIFTGAVRINGEVVRESDVPADLLDGASVQIQQEGR